MDRPPGKKFAPAGKIPMLSPTCATLATMMNSTTPPALRLAATLLALACAGCALRPNWHWEKPGSTEESYTADINHCKNRVYSGTSGTTTNETVRHMHACMTGKGWVKVEN